MTNLFPKLHNAMWPGLVGKGDEAVSYTHLTLPTILLV